ncbi:hypothetical protein NKT34_25790 [Paenibacillus polysaccharolyticus]|uniref:hypothetical protein n=1 Tax=Paenibacillus polysaccharolyticus TaxID=582692 RepID=UPI0020A19DE8|nr:hypothetical protein [Paenibacillus polysaccharolyticus]MCP1136684.1 hypothetical protein [Paenibacillus polysaccharolyticus]
MKNNKPEASVKARMTGASGLCRQGTPSPGGEIACYNQKAQSVLTYIQVMPALRLFTLSPGS